MKKRSFFTIYILLYTLNFTTCSSSDKKSDFEKTVSFEDKTSISREKTFQRTHEFFFDSNAVYYFIDSFPLFTPIKIDLLGFYRKRFFSYAWFDDTVMIESASNLYKRIINIKEEGLPDNLLYKNEFNRLIDKYRNNDNRNIEMLDIMISAQYLSYSKFAWQGIDKNKIQSLKWLLPAKESNVKVILDSILNGKYILDDTPVFYQYTLLKKYLKKYHEIQNGGGFPKIIYSKQTYLPGNSYPFISKLRTFLFINNDINEDNKSNIYDSIIKIGIKNYQKRMGLNETETISQSLINEMNVSVEKRIQQIIVNMERCRWIPAETSGDFIIINIPDFKLHLFENDSLLWSMKIIVGKNNKQTVAFSSRIEYIVFNPYWNVPQGIMKKEIMPALARNKNYLTDHNMEWHDGIIRQRPGPNNALGLIKFVFPNTHSIYMHDTPVKSLFKEEKRAFSHGCIRLEEPKKLALYLLRNEPEWNEYKINQALKRGNEHYVRIKKNMPVFITYFTCWVDKNGKLNFRNDVYNKDSRLAKMILEKSAL